MSLSPRLILKEGREGEKRERGERSFIPCFLLSACCAMPEIDSKQKGCVYISIVGTTENKGELCKDDVEKTAVSLWSFYAEGTTCISRLAR